MLDQKSETALNRIIISGNRFLDLIECVYPVIDNEKRPSLNCFQLNIFAEKRIMEAISTNGHTLSVAQRPFGYKVEGAKQKSLLDMMEEKIDKDITWYIRKIDCGMLIMALKELNIKRNEEKEYNLVYIQIEEIEVENKENKVIRKKLKISILGNCSQIVFEPSLLERTQEDIEFPNWKAVINENIEQTNCLAFNPKNLSIVKSCWGSNENFLMTFCGTSQPCKITRMIPNEENENDLILLMPVNLDKDDKDKKIAKQLEIIKFIKEDVKETNETENEDEKNLLFNSDQQIIITYQENNQDKEIVLNG